MYDTKMTDNHGSFFTSIGCMDGRVQSAIAEFGRKKFGAVFPDTITEAGLDGLLGHLDETSLLDPLKQKILISVEKHHSKGIVVHGHEDCAGNPVSEMEHKDDIRESVREIQEMVQDKTISVVGVYVHLNPQIIVEEI